eukprot:TRINITY_DN2642_c0_g1_i13.p1 TRINITY_DN2642_c0_g1~~TRINITY_DN2642_c0_g1_i13.p1  ORF type:complete len:188 (-),score=59.93 TRINITY_DN2642_c0_g1_i13:62-625(-)
MFEKLKEKADKKGIKEQSQILKDERFSKLFSDERFKIDKNSNEYILTNPSENAAKNKKQYDSEDDVPQQLNDDGIQDGDEDGPLEIGEDVDMEQYEEDIDDGDDDEEEEEEDNYVSRHRVSYESRLKQELRNNIKERQKQQIQQKIQKKQIRKQENKSGNDKKIINERIKNLKKRVPIPLSLSLIHI